MNESKKKNDLVHSGTGRKWKNHKYLRIENGRYIYPKDSSSIKKPHKLVEKDIFNGGTRKSSLAQKRSFDQKVKRNKRDFYKKADDSTEKYIQDANKRTYNRLKAIDDNYYKSVKELHDFEDPKYIKNELNASKKMLNKTIDEISKELVDNTLETKIMKRKISKAKKMLNSKTFDRMANLLSRVGSQLAKMYNKQSIKELDKQRKESKATVAKNHKEHITRTKKYHNDWKNHKGEFNF